MLNDYEHKKMGEDEYSDDKYIEAQEYADSLYGTAGGNLNEGESEDRGKQPSSYEYSFYLAPDIDDLNTDSAPDKAINIHSSSPGERESGLEKIIADAFRKKLPQFTQYQRKGYNIPRKDLNAISSLNEILLETASLKKSPVQQKLLKQAAHFLGALASLPDQPETAELQKQTDLANRLTSTLTEALTALSTVAKVNGDWQTRTRDVVSQQLDRLSAEAARRIGTAGTLPVSNENASHLRQQLTSLMFSNSHDHAVENVKFRKLKNSLLAEDRITRIRLASWLEHTAVQVLTGAEDARRFATQELYGGQLPPGPAEAEWAAYTGGSSFPAFKLETGEPESGWFLRIMLAVSETLKEAATALSQQAADLRPSEEKTGEIYQDPLARTLNVIKKTPGKIAELNKEIRFAAGLAGNQVRKTVGTVRPRVGRRPAVPYGSNMKAIKDTALLLLDELHQAERQIRRLPSFALELQEAVEQRQILITQTAALPYQPVLNALLDEELKKEETRWNGRVQQAQEKLELLVAPLLRFKQEKWAEDFYHWLREVLFSQQAETAVEREERERFQRITKNAVRVFADIARQVDNSVLRLAGHGHAGGDELNRNAGHWLRQLNTLESQVTVGMAEIIGAPLKYYSRGGMLARGVAEWAQELKQTYLAKGDAEEHDAETALFEKALMKVFAENRRHFQKKSDPEAAGFLQRVKIELKNVAQNTTVYPPSPEEILAGARTVPEDIRRWAEKKVVSGALSAVLRQGFNIVSGPLSLPGRLVIRGAKSGLAMYRGAEAINRGVRFGQGAASRVKNQFIRQELSKAAFRLTMSLSPLASWGLAASIQVERLSSVDKYGKKFITKTLAELPEELLWRGGYASISSAFQTLFAQAIEQSERQETGQRQDKGRIPTQATETKLGHKVESTTALRAGFMQAVPADESDYQSEQEQNRGHHIRKREVTRGPVTDEPADYNVFFNSLDDNVKRATYYNAIRYKLKQIEDDNTYSEKLRHNAYLAGLNSSLLKQVFINYTPVSDILFLPISEGGNAGLIIDLTSPEPGYWIDNPTQLRDNTQYKIPKYGSQNDLYWRNFFGQLFHAPSTLQAFVKLKEGNTKYFTYYNNGPDYLSNIAKDQVRNSKNEMQPEYEASKSKKILIQSAIAGSKLAETNIRIEQTPYELQTTWENLSTAEYLRSVAHPFSKLAGQVQLMVSESKGETIQQAEASVQKAENIGSWFDVSAGAVTSLTGTGFMFNILQSAAEIGADVAEGKDPDPLAVAALAVGCIPQGKLAAKIGKVNKIAGKSTKYVLSVGNKIIDLSILGRSVKTAVESGEPLAIYQALLTSGMSVKNSYDMAKNMSSKLKITRPIEESAQLDQLIAIENQAPQYPFSPNMPVRNFRIGKTELLGKIINGEIEISSNNGVKWERGGKLHLLAYRLQNAGGKSKQPETSHSASPHPDEQQSTSSASSPQSGSISALRTGSNYSKSIDPVRNEPHDTSVSDNDIMENKLIIEKENIHALLADDPHLKSYTRSPDGNCDKAADRVIHILSQQGYSTKVIGCIMYPKPMEGTPLNHYSVVASKNNHEFIIDITFDQFIAMTNRNGKWVITSREEWSNLLAKSNRRNNHLIMVKEYTTLSRAKEEISTPDDSLFIESSYVEDPEFRIINMPDFFMRNLKESFKLDARLVSNEMGIEIINKSEESITTSKKELAKLKKDEYENYVIKTKTVPPKLEDKIMKLKRKIEDLKKTENTKSRVDAYLELCRNNLATPGIEKFISTPVSENLANLITSAAENNKVPTKPIETLDEKGLAVIEGKHYLLQDGVPFFVHRLPEANRVSFNNGEYNYTLKFNKYGWDIESSDPLKTRGGLEKKLVDEGATSLKNQGLLEARENTLTSISFEFIRIDKVIEMNRPQLASTNGLNTIIRDKVSLASGDFLSSKSLNGPVMGNWHEGDIYPSVEFIKIGNGSSGCIGIRIPLEKITENKPLIISAGELSGGTMIYANDDNYFYAYHTGQQPGDSQWATSNQGVEAIYQAHQAMTGMSTPSFLNKKLNNQDLPNIFSSYSSSLIVYMGKTSQNTGDTRVLSQGYTNVKSFDYNASKAVNSDYARLGLAYAVITREGDNVNVSAISEDMAIKLKNGKIKALSSESFNKKVHAPEAENQLSATQVDRSSIAGSSSTTTSTADSSVEDAALKTGQHKGTFSDPKTLNEYGYPGDIYRIDNGNYYGLKTEGRPSEHGWLNPGQSRDHFYDHGDTSKVVINEDLAHAISLTFPVEASVNDSILKYSAENPPVYVDANGKLYMNIQGKFYPFKYYDDNSGYLYWGKKAITVIRKNGTWARGGITPPESMVDDALEYKVNLMHSDPNLKNSGDAPYAPTEGDFQSSTEDAIYRNRDGKRFIYVNNHYIPFNYGFNDSLDYIEKYQGRIGEITIGNEKIKVYRQEWLWSTIPF